MFMCRVVSSREVEVWPLSSMVMCKVFYSREVVIWPPQLVCSHPCHQTSSMVMCRVIYSREVPNKNGISKSKNIYLTN